MEKRTAHPKTAFDLEKEVSQEQQRRENDRRKECCEGFTYISTVGWICRRERIRRRAVERSRY